MTQTTKPLTTRCVWYVSLLLCPQSHRMLTDFQNSLTERLGGKFVIKLSSNVLPLLGRVAILPCKIQSTSQYSTANGCVFIVQSLCLHRRQCIKLTNRQVFLRKYSHKLNNSWIHSMLLSLDKQTIQHSVTSTCYNPATGCYTIINNI